MEILKTVKCRELLALKQRKKMCGHEVGGCGADVCLAVYNVCRQRGGGYSLVGSFVLLFYRDGERGLKRLPCVRGKQTVELYEAYLPINRKQMLLVDALAVYRRC